MTEAVTLTTCTRLLVLALLTAASTFASALTTLTYRWSGSACGIVSRGSTIAQPCSADGTSFTALLQPGESLFVRATLSYTYHDDGLPLDPGQLHGFQMDVLGQVVRFFDHEAAGLFFGSIPADCRGCGQPPNWFGGFGGPRTIVLGDNAMPDDLTGQVSFSTVAGITPLSAPEVRTAAFFVLVERTFSGVSPVPEPSTHALMLAGLLLVGIYARRCRRRLV